MASSRRTATSENVSTYGGVTRDYTALTTWEQATDIDLVAATQSEVLECYDDAASFDDYVDLSGATTNSSYFRIIRPASGQGHDGTPNNGVTFISTAAATVLRIGEATSQIQDMIAALNINSTGTQYTFKTYNIANAGFVGCMAVNSANANTGGAGGFYMQPSTYGFAVNCLAHNCKSQGFINQTGTPYFYNCTATNNGADGFAQVGGTATAKNCCSSGHTNDWSGTWTQTTCTAEDATPTYVNAAGDDFHLASDDTVCKDQGTDLSADATYAFDDDIDKVVRTGAWDIGFDEYVAAGGLAIPIAMYHLQEH